MNSKGIYKICIRMFPCSKNKQVRQIIVLSQTLAWWGLASHEFFFECYTQMKLNGAYKNKSLKIDYHKEPHDKYRFVASSNRCIQSRYRIWGSLLAKSPSSVVYLTADILASVVYGRREGSKISKSGKVRGKINPYGHGVMVSKSIRLSFMGFVGSLLCCSEK